MSPGICGIALCGLFKKVCLPTSDEEYCQCFMGLQNIYDKGESSLGMFGM
jgi:hypothetical protein